MIVHRGVIPRWRAPDDIVSGQGAALYGINRWTPSGIRAVYCCENEGICFSELGSHTVIEHLPGLRASTVAPIDYRHLLEVPRVLAEINASIMPSELLDLSSEPAFDTFCGNHGLIIGFEESLSSNHLAIRTRTQAVGQMAYDEDYPGLILRSARAAGNCIVFFPFRVALRVKHRSPLKISPCARNKKWGGTNPASISSSQVIVEAWQSATWIEHIVSVEMRP